jgi:hypothetical protein
MRKFRIPRKIKKKLKGRWLFFPSKKDGSSQMAFPCKKQEHYNAYKSGILRDMFSYTKEEKKQRSIEWDKKYNTPIEISDDELIIAVNNIFAEEYRKWALRILRQSKEHNVAIKSYYNFVNAYKLNDGTTACLSVDSAEDNLRKSK